MLSISWCKKLQSNINKSTVTIVFSAERSPQNVAFKTTDNGHMISLTLDQPINIKLIEEEGNHGATAFRPTLIQHSQTQLEFTFTPEGHPEMHLANWGGVLLADKQPRERDEIFHLEF